MATECKEGEFTLTYNTGKCGHPVALTPEQHQMLQLLLTGLGEINVVKQIAIEYKRL